MFRSDRIEFVLSVELSRFYHVKLANFRVARQAHTNRPCYSADMLESQLTSPNGFLHTLWSTPSPWIGGVIGGLITGGFFGWVAYLRNIRPTLIFFRTQEGNRRTWQLQNVGQGVAAYVRIRDFASDKKTVVKKVRTYPIGPADKARELEWVTAGGKLEASYTDVYGRR